MRATKWLLTISTAYMRHPYLVSEAKSARIREWSCIQNIFIGLRRKRGSLSEVKSIKSYLFKCLQRDLIRELNKKGGTKFTAEVLDEGFFHIEVSFETKLIQQEKKTEQKIKIQ